MLCNIIWRLLLVASLTDALPTAPSAQQVIRSIAAIPSTFQRIDQVFTDQNPQAGQLQQSFLVASDLYVLGRAIFNSTHTAAQLARFTRSTNISSTNFTDADTLNIVDNDTLLVWSVQFLTNRGSLDSSIHLAGMTVNPQPDQDNNDIYIAGHRWLTSESDPLLFTTTTTQPFMVRIFASNGTLRQPIVEWTAPLPRSATNQSFANETVRAITFNTNQQLVYVVSDVSVTTNNSIVNTAIISRLFTATCVPRWNDTGATASPPVWSISGDTGVVGDSLARRILFAFGHIFVAGQQKTAINGSIRSYLCSLWTNDGSAKRCTELLLVTKLSDMYYSVNNRSLFLTGVYNNSAGSAAPFLIQYHVNGTGETFGWSLNASISTAPLHPLAVAYLPDYATVFLGGWRENQSLLARPFISSVNILVSSRITGATNVTDNIILDPVLNRDQSQLVGFAVDARSNLLYFAVWNGTVAQLYRFSPQNNPQNQDPSTGDENIDGKNGDGDIVWVFGISVPAVQVNYAVAAGVSVAIIALVSGIAVFVYRKYGINRFVQTVPRRYGRI